MSKERELIEALRQSIDDTGATAEAARQAASGAAPAPGGGAGAIDFNQVMDWATAFATSMANDPVFYFKVTAILVMTALVIMAAYYLIASG